MNKFSEIDSIRIKMDGEKTTTFINNKKVEPYNYFGAHFLASEIEAVKVNQLAYLHPLMVEFDESYIKLANVKHMEKKVLSLNTLDNNYAEVFVNFVTPDDIEEKGLHEPYQKALESIVKTDKGLLLDKPVRGKFAKVEKKKLEALKESSKDTSVKFDFSEVGYLQFTYYAEVETFDEIFRYTNKIVANLDKKARAILKRK